MTQGQKGYIARTLEEKDRGGARTAIGLGRWAYVIEQMRGRFSKLVLLNLLLLLFCIPLVILFLLRQSYILAGGQTMPFSGWLFVGFPAYPALEGVGEQVILSVDRFFGAIMVLGLIVAAIGIAGALHVVRNMIRTGGEFTLREFWKGIGVNAKTALPAAAVCGIPAYLFVLAIDYSNYLIGAGEGSAGWLIAGIVAASVGIALLVLIFFWTLSVGANYDVGFWTALKTAVALTFRLFPLNLLYGAMTALPLVLVFLLGGLGTFFQTLGFALMILIGIIFMVIVWMNYSQWAFDGLVGAAQSVKQESAPQPRLAAENKAEKEYEESLEAAMEVKSDLASRPIKPLDDGLALYELPASFTRGDLKKLRDSKDKMDADAKQYAEAHKNDEKYVAYNAHFEQLERERLEKEKEAQKAAKKKKKRGESAQ